MQADSARTPAAASSRPRFPSFDLEREYESLRTEIEPVVRAVLASGRYIGGPEVERFEAEFAAACGTAHGVAVSSGTDALRFALIAAGVGPGDEVVTSPFTFIGTTEAISQCGARPVFCDVERGTFTLDPARLEAAIGPRSRAILPVHLYGQTADMARIGAIAARLKLAVVEDACQAHGAAFEGRAAGSLGTAGTFSFYPTKNLGGCGEGGLVTTSDAAIAARVRRLRDHGQSEKYLHAEEGYNGRLDALQAAILRVKLRHLASWNETRRALAARYRQRLGALETRGLLRLPVERPGSRHVYHLYVVRVPSGAESPSAAGSSSGAGSPSGATPRDRLRAALLDRGVETGVHYPIPLHLQPCYKGLGLKAGSFPESEAAAREVMSLPLHPFMTVEAVERISDAVAEVLAA